MAPRHTLHYTIATVCSNTNLEGEKQQGIPHNNMWDAHLLKHKSDDTCKVAIYTKKTLLAMQTV